MSRMQIVVIQNIINLIRASLVKGALATLFWPVMLIGGMFVPFEDHRDFKKLLLVPYGLTTVRRHHAETIFKKRDPSRKSPYRLCTYATHEIVAEMSRKLEKMQALLKCTPNIN